MILVAAEADEVESGPDRREFDHSVHHRLLEPIRIALLADAAAEVSGGADGEG